MCLVRLSITVCCCRCDDVTSMVHAERVDTAVTAANIIISCNIVTITFITINIIIVIITTIIITITISIILFIILLTVILK